MFRYRDVLAHPGRDSVIYNALQDYAPDIMLGEMFYQCTPIIARDLNVSWINYWAIGPMEPFFTSLWRGNKHRLFVPNPLSYFPQNDAGIITQRMVGSPAMQPISWRATAANSCNKVICDVCKSPKL